MRIYYGDGISRYGTGVQIDMTGDEVATAIDAFLVAHGVTVIGARTIKVNGKLCEFGGVYVDPCGSVNTDDHHWAGSGPGTAT